MESLIQAPEPTTGGARCQSHPDQAVLGTCARCGTFICALDREEINDKDYCKTCATRPDVDYLEAFRLKYWGKRDTWTWLVGFSALLSFASGAGVLLQEELGDSGLLVGLLSLASSAVGVCFWLGLPFARLALCFVPVVSLVVSVFTTGPDTATRQGAMVSGFWPIIIAISIYNNTRNKLFFKEELSRKMLENAWNLYANNTVARTGFLLSIIGLVVFPLALISLSCSVIGLRRVDPTATPPVGRRKQAIAGIVLSVLSIVIWSSFWVVSKLDLLS